MRQTRWNAISRRCCGLAFILAIVVAGSASAEHVHIAAGDIIDADLEDLESVSFDGVPYDGSAEPPPGARTMTIVQRVDKATVKLQEAIANGTAMLIPQAKLAVRKPGGSGETIEYTLRNARITSVRRSASGTTEEVVVTFQGIQGGDASDADLTAAAGGGPGGAPAGASGGAQFLFCDGSVKFLKSGLKEGRSILRLEERDGRLQGSLEQGSRTFYRHVPFSIDCGGRRPTDWSGGQATFEKREGESTVWIRVAHPRIARCDLVAEVE